MTNLAIQLEKINNELDISIESSENIINELDIQDKQIKQITILTDSIEDKVTWSEYLINIINTYFGFLWLRTPKFFYKSKSNDETEDDNIKDVTEDDNIKDVTEDDDDFFNKINEVKKNSIKIGDIIDKQNDNLLKHTDNIDRLDHKINEVLVNQINV